MPRPNETPETRLRLWFMPTHQKIVEVPQPLYRETLDVMLELDRECFQDRPRLFVLMFRLSRVRAKLEELAA